MRSLGIGGGLLLLSVLAIGCGSSDAGASAGVFEDVDGFRVRLEYPGGWQRNPDYDLLFDSRDGFVAISAQEGPGGLDGAVSAIAEHKLEPYGANPTVETVTVDGREGRVIRPSADQHPDLRNQVALVVPRTPPMAIGGETYTYLVVEADGAHFEAIRSSVRLLGEDASAASQQFALVATVEDGRIIFDPADLLDGEEALRAAREDGVIGPNEDLPNDFYIQNRSPDVSMLPAGGDFRATLLDGRTLEPTVHLDYDGFEAMFADPETASNRVYGFVPGAFPMQLTIEAGQVTRAQQVYLP